MSHKFLVHDREDNVGVAVTDIDAGERAYGVVLEENIRTDKITVVDDIPLVHKIALEDIKAHEEIIKYGRVIGRATENILKGAYVHNHNVRSVRWNYEK